MRWFTSDTHFGHANIIKYCNRPFASVAIMDAVIRDNWNSLVNKEDTVYHLGDVSFMAPDRTTHMLNNLNGHKTLIIGNHDRSAHKMKDWGFDEVHPSLEISLGDEIWNLSHYPYKSNSDLPYEVKFDSKRLKDDGRNLICGHVHTAWDVKPGQYKNWMINVGVDQWKFKPISEVELLAFKRSLK
jgi:calcineurin-like phosphoesterase family protein